MKQLEQVLINLGHIETCEKQIEEFKSTNSKLLATVRSEFGSSFEHEGKFYSIRSRGGTNYLASSDVPFGSWRKSQK